MSCYDQVYDLNITVVTTVSMEMKQISYQNINTALLELAPLVVELAL